MTISQDRQPNDSTLPTRAELDQAAQWIDQQAAGRFDALAAQVASLSAALASGVVIAAPNGNSTAPDVPQLTPEEIAAREARVKARKW